MVQWNAEKDQIILKGIFKFHDIKSSAPLLKYLAEQIGDDCTPKAVSHRLNNIRNHGKPLSNGSAASTPTKTAAMFKTPQSRTKAGAKKKPIEITSESDSGGPEGLQNSESEEIDSPSAGRGTNKRAKSIPKRSYAEPDTEENEDAGKQRPVAKRVKAESMEEDDGGYVAFGTGMDDEYNDI